MEFDFAGYLEELSHFELFEAYFLVRNALVSDVTIFMTVLFAYITVAYFVSAKLSRFQAIAISTLYSLFALYMASSAFFSLKMLSAIGSAVSGLDSSWEANAIATILVVAWVFSILLFIQARKKGLVPDLSEEH